MRYPFTILLALTWLASCGDSGPELKDYPLDHLLRVNHSQAKGTHNSYHLDPGLGVAPWAYSHAPLDKQLSSQGVRQLELDIYWDSVAKDFRVFHVPIVDNKSTCDLLSDCLGLVRRWSEGNPQHLPLMIMIEPKDDVDPYPFANPYFRLEEKIKAALGRTRVLTPDDLKGSHASPLEAVTKDGWPSLGKARGKVILALLAGEKERAHYTANDKHLNGRLMFAMGAEGKSFGVVVSYNNPIKDGDKIKSAVKRGLLVRTRADSESVEPAKGDTSKRQAALASGAHYVSTDYPVKGSKFDYQVQIPGGTPARCNPINAPGQCTSLALEDAAP